jgi:hypothetical protein
MSVSKTLASSTFERQLEFGQIAETQIAKWIIARGNLVLPIYDVEIHAGKGPRLFGGIDAELVAPDLLVMSRDGVYWIEAKHKTVFTWHRITRRWVTGIDIRHYEDYLKVAEQSPWEVWLLFLHQSGTPSEIDIPHGCPARCPVGLFGNTLMHLSRHENHRHRNWGRSGMVYWAKDEMKLLASLDEINRSANNQ